MRRERERGGRIQSQEGRQRRGDEGLPVHPATTPSHGPSLVGYMRVNRGQRESEREKAPDTPNDCRGELIQVSESVIRRVSDTSKESRGELIQVSGQASDQRGHQVYQKPDTPKGSRSELIKASR